MIRMHNIYLCTNRCIRARARLQSTCISIQDGARIIASALANLNHRTTQAQAPPPPGEETEVATPPAIPATPPPGTDDSDDDDIIIEIPQVHIL